MTDADEIADLLKRRLVVVLAEGGSGKSTEFKRQARLQITAGQDAWRPSERATLGLGSRVVGGILRVRGSHHASQGDGGGELRERSECAAA
jgi:hypothetical protein